MAQSKRGKGTPTPHVPTIPPDLTQKRLQRMLEEIPDVRSAGPRASKLNTWQGNIKVVLSQYYGEESVVYREFSGIWFAPGIYYDDQPQSEFVEALDSGLEQAAGFLESRISELGDEIGSTRTAIHGSSPQVQNPDSRKVFLVHGHNDGIKETVARFLSKLGLQPIILHEQPDQGRTIIEKFEAHASDVRCAIVLLTADDIGYSKLNPSKQEQRARQNVILELGFFVGRMSRKQTFALVEKDLTLPSDVHGLIYIPFEDDHWRLRLVRELKAAGLDVDANLAI